MKNGPSLTEALENAGIFYEAQYKEVKVVANVSTLGLEPPSVGLPGLPALAEAGKHSGSAHG